MGFSEVGASPLLFVSGAGPDPAGAPGKRGGGPVPADRSALRRSIIGLLEPEFEAIGFALLDVRLFAGGGRLNVRIFVDAEGGVDLEGCVRASRSAEMLLEESRLLGEAYVIEVSSPGVRRPLRRPEHYAAHLGERIEVRLGRGARATTLRGDLRAVGPDGLTLERAAPREDARPADVRAAAADDAAADAEAGAAELGPASGPEPDGGEPGGAVVIGWDEIEFANLDPDFDIHGLINADRRRRKAERREERREARAAREAKAARRRKP